MNEVPVMGEIPLGPVRAFCIAGGHGGEEIIGNTHDGQVLPEGWRLVRVKRVYQGPGTLRGRWVQNSTGPASIVVCPEHSVEGE